MTRLIRQSKHIVGFSFLICLSAALLLSFQSEPSMGGAPVAKPATSTPPAATPSAGAVVYLGQILFNDVNLSNPSGQACATCHGIYTGFTFPLQKVNIASGIAPGAVKGLSGNRKPPTVNYAAFLPKGPPVYVPALGAFAGGLFWDGRATDLANQASMPFQNPNEMNDTVHGIGSPAMAVQKLENGYNAYLFRQTYGMQIFQTSNTAAIFNLMNQAIAAYESSAPLSPFSSKYDQYVRGRATLSSSEMAGLQLMTGSTTGRPGGPPNYKNAQCFLCHGIPSTPGQGIDIWTNSCYANIGVPKNPNNPYYKQTNANTDPGGYNAQGVNYIDLGLGGTYYPTLKLPPGNLGSGNNGQGDYLAINGTFKAPTLRNVDKRPMSSFVKCYTHNGVFKDLKTVVHFYNTRNLTTYPGEVIDFTKANPYAHLKGTPLWAAPEYPSAVTLQNPSGAPGSASAQVGNLGLTDAEEDNIVAFLKTLSDGYSTSYPNDLPAPIK
jgi:cytochrome c peroxidase